VGEENVLAHDRAARYTVNAIVPPLVAMPGSREEAAALILEAREQDWALVPYGGGTQVEQGFPPRKLDLVLSTERLNRLVDYEPDDMTVTVEPGVTLAELERVLAERHQFLPLNPPLPERATVGGTVAAAATGPWRAGFGTPRDWVIGCRVIGADGKEVRGGGQVVKNVAGYDLPKLYTGSFGTLGLIIEVTFKVMPKPPAAGYCRASPRTSADAERLLARVLNSDLQPAALELAHGINRIEGEPEAEDTPWKLYCQFLHVQEAVDWQLQEFARLAEEAEIEAASLAVEAGETALRWFRDRPAQSPFVARLGMTSLRVAEVAEGAAEVCGRHGLPPLVTAHAASGQVYVAAEEGSEGLVRDLRGLAGGAPCVFPRLPQGLIGKVDPWGEPGPELRLMKGIKEALDPTALFSPGRFVGGL
jgi:glycolate dehydrogenase FAD-binding subunit